MNVVLWVVQVVLALLYVAGGAYKLFMFDELASQLTGLSRRGWGALGVLEMVFGILLVAPVPWKELTIPVAAVLALEALALAGLYSRHSLELTASNPLVWALSMGLLAAFVAYGRYALKPLA